MYASSIFAFAAVVAAPMWKLWELYKLQLTCNSDRTEFKAVQNNFLVSPWLVSVRNRGPGCAPLHARYGKTPSMGHTFVLVALKYVN